jgi:molybdopterin-containing oxidoreductase family iron-sulfur binding subunit
MSKRPPFLWSAPDPQDKTYWRSPEQIAETPEFKDFLEREFPDGASELKSPLSRRSFMTLMGASMGLAGLAGCRRPEEKILPYTTVPENMVIGIPTYYATAMPLGSQVYGLLVESNEGRPTKIEGNPEHPASQGLVKEYGHTNLFAQASILDLYDPDRSDGPVLEGKEGVTLVAHEPAGGHGEAAVPTLRKFTSEDVQNFLKGRRDALAGRQGAGLHILSGSLTSPTLLRLREDLKTALPGAKWHTWEALSEDNVRAGSRLAFGDDVNTHIDYAKADVIVAIDSDFLGVAPDSVRNMARFSSRRKVERAEQKMNRLYVAEAAWSVTGTNADHRLRLRPSLVVQFAAALAAELTKLGVALPAEITAQLPKAIPAGIDEKFVTEVAKDVAAARGKAVITVGASQPAAVHALVHALHAALGSVGDTVTFTRAADAGRPLDRDGLKELSAALDAATKDTVVVVLGANPAFDAPVDLRLGEKLGKATVIHLGLYRDETARLAALHIPRAHYLESWGDGRSTDGTASIIQPLIAPLYKGWSDIELVGFLVKGTFTRGYELVRDTWRGVAEKKMAPPPVPAPEPVAPPVEAKAKGGAKGKAAKVPAGVKAAVPAAAAGAAATGVVPAAVAPGAAAPAAAAPVAGAAAAPAAAGAAAPAATPPPGVPQQSLAVFFEHAWRKALHDGVIADSGFERPNLTVAADKAAGIGTELGKALGYKPQGMEIQFIVGNLYDGRFANNGWLQELPDPVTKLVWDNAAIVSIETAKRLGVEKDDMVRLAVGDQQLEAAVWVQAGQAADTVSIALGWGREREAVGRVAKGAGFNAYKLRRSEHLGFDEVTVTKLGSKYSDPRDDWFGDLVKVTGLVSTQDHFAMEGRPLVREASLTRFRNRPDFAQHAVHHPELKALWDEPVYHVEKIGTPAKVGRQQWGMTIDLSACTACGACTVACQAENNIPIVGKAQVRKGREMHWIRIDRYFSMQPVAFDSGHTKKIEITDDNTEVVHQPVPCMQCENAPCENVCPVAATIHSADGLNDMAYNRCVGTRYCSNNCPYKVRRFNFLDWRGDVEEVAKLKYNPDVTLRSRGVMEKCTYCVQRIRGAQQTVKTKNASTGIETVEDGKILTACQQVCPAEAILFGDITDASTKVSQAKLSPRNYAMLAEINTKPRTTYLARIRNPNPAIEPEKPEAGHGAAAGAHGAAAAPPGHGQAPPVEHKAGHEGGHGAGATHP